MHCQRQHYSTRFLTCVLPLLLLLAVVTAVPAVTDHAEQLRRNSISLPRQPLLLDTRPLQAPASPPQSSHSLDRLVGYLRPTVYQFPTFNGPTWLSRLRSKIIDSIWLFFNPAEVDSRPCVPKLAVTRASRSTLAQFGNQLILRFNISTQAEAKSLAEAVDVLFLDVWASSDSWTDVRVSNDVVRSPNRSLRLVYIADECFTSSLPSLVSSRRPFSMRIEL